MVILLQLPLPQQFTQLFLFTKGKWGSRRSGLGEVVAARSHQLSQGLQRPFSCAGPRSWKPEGGTVASASPMQAEHKMLPPPEGSIQPTACYNAPDKEGC